MSKNIKVIELHISNKCIHRCKICSQDYGGLNQHFADDKYIDNIIYQLSRNDDKRIECGVLQLGGCGEMLLNPKAIDFLRKIKKELPNQKTCLYTNFELFTSDVIEIIVKEKLINQIQVRIDSLKPLVYNWSTGGNLVKVINNINDFFRINDYVEFTIIYFPLHKYRQAVKQHLNKDPYYFKDEPELHDEWGDMVSYFDSIPKRKPYLKRISGICFWAERKDVTPSTTDVCRHIPGRENVFNEIAQVYANGNIGLCAYDSKQDAFVYGNIHETDLYDLWNGEAKKKMIDRIVSGEFYGKWPCVNARSCDFI